MNEFEHLRQISRQATLGNEAAVDYLLMVVNALHLWDDLIDKDKQVSDEKVNEVFTNLLIDLPRNLFFAAHAGTLTAITLNAIQNWHVANEVERADISNIPLECAFVLRSSYTDLVSTVATLCGGRQHGLEIARAIRTLAHSEEFSGYIDNLAAEKIAREKNLKE